MSARRRVLVMISSLLSCGLPGLAHENSLNSDSKDRASLNQNVASMSVLSLSSKESSSNSKGDKADSDVKNSNDQVSNKVMSNADIMRYLKEFKVNEEVCKPKVCYSVDWGDSLRAIADNCLGDVGKVSSIIDLNFLQDDNIHPQQILYLPQPENKDWVLYNTETGDSYESISQKFYGTWQLWTVIKGYQEKYLASEGHLLSAGQLIKIPRYPFRLGYYVDKLDTWLTISVKTTGSIDNAEKIANINECDVSKKPKFDSYLVIPENYELS